MLPALPIGPNKIKFLQIKSLNIRKFLVIRGFIVNERRYKTALSAAASLCTFSSRDA